MIVVYWFPPVKLVITLIDFFLENNEKVSLISLCELSHSLKCMIMKKDKIFKEGKKKNCQCQKMRFNIFCILQLKNETI